MNKQKEQAIKYMSIMKFPQHIIDQFTTQEQNLCLSYQGVTQPIPVELIDQFKQIEQEYNIMFYHITRTDTEFGICYECYYVSNEEDEWEYELEDVKHLRPFAYVINTSEPMFSEFGMVAIKVHPTYIQRVG